MFCCLLPGLPVSLSYVALLEFLVFITAPNVVPPMEDAAAVDATGEATSGKYQDHCMFCHY